MEECIVALLRLLLRVPQLVTSHVCLITSCISLSLFSSSSVGIAGKRNVVKTVDRVLSSRIVLGL